MHQYIASANLIGHSQEGIRIGDLKPVPLPYWGIRDLGHIHQAEDQGDDEDGNEWQAAG